MSKINNTHPTGKPITWQEQISRVVLLVICSVSIIGLAALLSFQVGRNFCVETLHRRKFKDQTKIPNPIDNKVSITSKSSLIPSSIPLSIHSDNAISQKDSSAVTPSTTAKELSPPTIHSDTAVSQKEPSLEKPQQVPYLQKAQRKNTEYYLTQLHSSATHILTGSPYLDPTAFRKLKKQQKSSPLSTEIQDSVKEYKENAKLFLQAEKEEILFLTKESHWNTASIKDQATILARAELLKKEMAPFYTKKAQKELLSLPTIHPDQAKSALATILSTINKDLCYPELSRNITPFLALIQEGDPLIAKAKNILTRSYEKWVEDSCTVAAIGEELPALYRQMRQVNEVKHGWKTAKRILHLENTLAKLQKHYGKGVLEELDEMIEEHPEHRKGIAQVLCKILEALIQQENNGSDPFQQEYSFIQANIVFLLKEELQDQELIWLSTVQECSATALRPQEEPPPTLSYHLPVAKQNPEEYGYQARALDSKDLPAHTEAMKKYQKQVQEWHKTLAPPPLWKRMLFGLINIYSSIPAPLTAPIGVAVAGGVAHFGQRMFDSMWNPFDTPITQDSVPSVFPQDLVQEPVLTPLALVHDLADPIPLVSHTTIGATSLYYPDLQDQLQKPSTSSSLHDTFHWLTHDFFNPEEQTQFVEKQQFLSLQQEKSEVIQEITQLIHNKQQLAFIHQDHQEELSSLFQQEQDDLAFAESFVEDPTKKVAEDDLIAAQEELLNLQNTLALHQESYDQLMQSLGIDLLQRKSAVQTVLHNQKNPLSDTAFSSLVSSFRTDHNQDNSHLDTALPIYQSLLDAATTYHTTLTQALPTKQQQLQASALEETLSSLQTGKKITQALLQADQKTFLSTYNEKITLMNEQESLLFTTGWKVDQEQKVATIQVQKQGVKNYSFRIILPKNAFREALQLSFYNLPEEKVTDPALLSFLLSLAHTEHTGKDTLQPEKILANALQALPVTKQLPPLANTLLGQLQTSLAQSSEGKMFPKIAALTLLQNIRSQGAKYHKELQKDQKKLEQLLAAIQSTLLLVDLAFISQGFHDQELEEIQQPLNDLKATLEGFRSKNPVTTFSTPVGTLTSWKSTLAKSTLVNTPEKTESTQASFTHRLEKMPLGIPAQKRVTDPEQSTSDIAFSYPVNEDDVEIFQDFAKAYGSPISLRARMLSHLYTKYSIHLQHSSHMEKLDLGLSEEVLEAQKKYDPSCERTFEQLIITLIEKAESTKKPAIKAFAAYLNRYLAASSTDPSLFPDPDEELFLLLKSDDDNTKRLGHYFRALSLSFAKQLPIEKAVQLMESYQFIITNGIPKELKESTLYTKERLEHITGTIHKERLEELSENPEYARRLEEAVVLGSIKLDTVNEKLKQDALFKRIFSGKDLQFTGEKDGVLSATDGKDSYRIFSEQNPVVYQKKIDDQWMSANDATVLDIDFPFIKQTGDILWASKEQTTLHYEGKDPSIPDLVMQHDGEKWQTFLKDNIEDPLLLETPEWTALLDQISDKQERLVFGKGSPKTILLHSKGITFTKNAQILESKQLKNYGLPLHPLKEHFIKRQQLLLPDQSGFLPLIKGDDQLGFVRPQEGEPILFIEKKGRLVPDVTKEQATVANTFLAKVFLQNSDYETASWYIAKVSQAILHNREKRTEKEINALIDFIHWEREDGIRTTEQSAVQLQAAALLEQQISMGYYTPKPTFENPTVAPLLSTYQREGLIPSLHIPNTTLDLIAKKWAHPMLVAAKFGKALPTAAVKEHTHLPETAQLISSDENLFFRSIAKDVITLFAFLWEPAIAPDDSLKEIQSFFGVSEEQGYEETASIITKTLEIRHDYLQMRAEWAPSEELTQEIHITETLLAVARADFTKTTREENVKSLFSQVFSAIWHWDSSLLPKNEKILLDTTGMQESEVALYNALLESFIQQTPNRPQTITQIFNFCLNPPIKSAERLPFSSEPEPSSIKRAVFSLQPTDVKKIQKTALSKKEQKKIFSMKEVDLTATQNPFTPSSSSPIANEALSELKEAWEAIVQQEKSTPEIRNFQEVEELFTWAKQESDDLLEKEQEYSRRLQKSINRADQRRKFALLQGKEQPLTQKDLFIALRYGKENGASSLLSLNPSLTEKEVSVCVNLAMQLLLTRRKRQNRVRIRDQAEKVFRHETKQGRGFAKHVFALYSAVNDKVRYDPFTDPLLLIMETELNIGFWDKQTKTLLDMRPEPGKPLTEWTRWIQELAMGLGKTYVISPILLAILADKEHLAISVLPENIIGIQVPEVAEQLENAYDMDLVVMPIDRADWTKDRIARYRIELHKNMIEQRPIAWSPTDLQTLINSALETFYQADLIQQSIDIAPSAELYAEREKLSGRIQEWQKLIHFIRTKGISLGDEIHAIMDLLTTYHLTLGDPIQVSQDEREAATYFFQVDLQLGEASNKKSILYRLLNRNEQSHSPIKGFLQSLSLSNYQKVQKYLSSNPSVRIKEIEQIVESATKDTKKVLNFLAVWKESLGGLEEKEGLYMQSKDAQLGKQYAPNKGVTEGCPADEGRPIENALFGHNLQRLYYTLHMFQTIPIPEDVVESDLANLLKKFRNEIKQGISQGPAKQQLLQRYSGSVINKDRIPLSIRSYTPEQIKEITEQVNNNPQLRSELTNEFYLKEIKVYLNQVATSTHMYGLMTTLGGAMTGTAGNRRTFQHLFSKFAPSTTSVEIAREILEIAPDDQQDVRTVEYTTDMDSLITSLSDSLFQDGVTLLDGTGRLPSTKETASTLLRIATNKNPKITRVVYFENNQAQMLQLGQKNPQPYNKKEVDPDSVIVIYDTARGTGTDIPQDYQRKAVMVVGRHSGWDQTQQLLKRMRKTGKDRQRVETITWKQDEPYIKEVLHQYLGRDQALPLSLQDLLLFMVINDAIKKADLHFFALDTRQKMTIVDPVFSTLFDPNTAPQHAIEAFGKAKELFIDTKKLEPWDSYKQISEQVKVGDAIAQMTKSWRNNPVIEEAEKNPSLFPFLHPESIRGNINAITQSYDLGPMHANVTIGQSLNEVAMANEVTESQMNVNTNTQNMNQEMVWTSKMVSRFSPPKKNSASIYNERAQQPLPEDLWDPNAFSPLTNRKQLEPGKVIPLEKTIPSLSPELHKRIQNIQCSLDVCPDYDAEKVMTPEYIPFSQFQVWPSFALIQKRNDREKIILLSDIQADQALRIISEKDPSTLPDKTEVTLVDLYDHSAVSKSLKGTKSQQLLQDLVLVKLLFGIENFHDKELAQLKLLLSSEFGEELFTWYTKVILSQKPDTQEIFEELSFYPIVKKLRLERILQQTSEPVAERTLFTNLKANEAANIVGYLQQEGSTVRRALEEMIAHVWHTPNRLQHALETLLPGDEQKHVLNDELFSYLGAFFRAQSKYNHEETIAVAKGIYNFDPIKESSYTAGMDITDFKVKIVNEYENRKNLYSTKKIKKTKENKEINIPYPPPPNYSPSPNEANKEFIQAIIEKTKTIDWKNNLPQLSSKTIIDQLPLLLACKKEHCIQQELYTQLAETAVQAILKEPERALIYSKEEMDQLFEDTIPSDAMDLTPLLEMIAQQQTPLTDSAAFFQSFLWVLNKGSTAQREQIGKSLDQALQQYPESIEHILLADRFLLAQKQGESPILQLQTIVKIPDTLILNNRENPSVDPKDLRIAKKKNFPEFLGAELKSPEWDFIAEMHRPEEFFTKQLQSVQKFVGLSHKKESAEVIWALSGKVLLPELTEQEANNFFESALSMIEQKPNVVEFSWMQSIPTFVKKQGITLKERDPLLSLAAQMEYNVHQKWDSLEKKTSTLETAREELWALSTGIGKREDRLISLTKKFT